MASAVLTHPQANKADAVATLISSIGIERSQVLALGDAEADAGMLAWAGVGVAMGNAMPQARKVATWIAPSHDQAGFAAAVRRFVLNNNRAFAE
jgi:hydroxymethylpyrimidine pyrophosphatase-like HAD family hydrolase